MASSNVVTTAGFQGEEGEKPDRSAAGLQFQRYSMGVSATGVTLGIGRRTVVDPTVLFKSPPMSGAQFGSSRNARETIGDNSSNSIDEQEEF